MLEDMCMHHPSTHPSLSFFLCPLSSVFLCLLFQSIQQLHGVAQDYYQDKIIPLSL